MNDPEIDAASAITSALVDLDDEQRSRVLRWTAERFGVPLAQGGLQGRGAIDRAADPEDEITDEEVAEETPKYEDFSHFYGAAAPEKNEDKALVAAYWVQVFQGHDQWPSRLLNNELKDMGHSIKNITDALTSNINKKPQRVRQVRKNGLSRQGNKTYKVTHEGLAYVQQMLSQGDV